MRKSLLAVFLVLGISSVFAQDQCKPIGWATKSGRTTTDFTVTGGGNASPITVTTFADLKQYAADGTPRVIYVSGPVGNGWSGTTGDQLIIASNKTIIGLKAKTELKAVIKISGGSNIIIRNLVIHGPGSNSDQAWDNFLVQGNSKNIWVDHCEFWNGQDGNADVVKGADNVTFTWCIFGYTINSTHNLSNLIASSDTESVSVNKLNVTLMMNWFQSVSQRTPRCRFGNIHVVNNLFTEDLAVHVSESGVANGVSCNVKTENNHFIGINDPINISMQSGAGSVQESAGNVFENTSGNKTGSGTAFTPPYEYKTFMVDASKVKALVQAGAGATLTSPTSCVSGGTDSPSLTLTSGVAAQTVNSGTAIGNIVYTWGGNATGVTVSGLPAGLVENKSGKTLTISGIPTASGKFVVSTTQPAGTAVSSTGEITVLPALTVKIAAIDKCEGVGVNESKNLGFEQSAYFNLDNVVGSSVKYVVNASAGTSAQLVVRFANGGSTDRTMSVKVNQTASSDIAFPGSGDWTKWQYQMSTMALQAGRNEILLTSKTSDGGPNLDWIGWSGSGLSKGDCSSTNLSPESHGSASWNASMYGQMLRVQGNGTMRADVLFLSITGQVLWRGMVEPNSTSQSFDLSAENLKTGLYLVKVIPEFGSAQVFQVPYPQ